MYSTQTVSNDNQKPYIEDRKTIQRSKIKDKQESTNGLHRKWILNNKIFTKNWELIRVCTSCSYSCICHVAHVI